MDNSVYIALSRQTALFRDIAVTANNVANAATTGYQAEQTLFSDYLVDDGNRRKMAFTQDIATYHDFRQGAMQVTGNSLDVAIQGSGFFTVETPAGERYTRAGSFQQDGQGFLITSEGYPVLDQGGQRIQFQPEDRDIRIGENGSMVIDGEERAVLGVVEFANPQLLQRMSGTMYEAIPGQAPQEAVESRVLYGTLEKSNVSPVTELVRLTELSRGAGSTAKFIEVMYDLQRKASNTFTKQS